jgi:phage regulator Rha-like protein
MNSLIATNNESLTMSSREIARLVNSRHADLMRSIDRLSQKDVISSYTPMAYTNDSNGQRYFEYLVCKRDTYIIVAQNSPEFTAALVDRWQELETKPALTHEQQVLMIATQLIETTKQRDEAIATKAHINDKRTATLMNKASQDSKRIKKLEDRLQDEGQYVSLLAAGLPQRVDTELKDNVQTFRILKNISTDLELPPRKVDDQRYGKVNTYHNDVIEQFKKMYL